jgi:uncharacterized protein YbjT (DUF2867 family)
MQLLIVGGTGTSGRVLTRSAAAAGHHARVLSRRAGQLGPDGPHLVRGDLTTGNGLDEAVDGVDAVVDLSNISTARYRPASAFFTTATDHLFTAEQRANVAHHLTLSIVGVDRFPSAYYRAKLDQEAAVTAASARTGVGHSIVRVTQFHDFAALVLQRFRFRRLVLAPPLHSQPVHLQDVADHVLAVLTDGPAGYAPRARRPTAGGDPGHGAQVRPGGRPLGTGAPRTPAGGSATSQRRRSPPSHCRRSRRAHLRAVADRGH